MVSNSINGNYGLSGNSTGSLVSNGNNGNGLSGNSTGSLVSNGNNIVSYSFKIQKVSEELFDQDVKPESWLLWKDSIESYCTSFGNVYVEVLKSKVSKGSNEVKVIKDGLNGIEGKLDFNDAVIERINAQIHALLLNNLSSETRAKYRYKAKIGDGALLWNMLCESNELNTRQLQLSIRQEIFNAKITK